MSRTLKITVAALAAAVALFAAPAAQAYPPPQQFGSPAAAAPSTSPSETLRRARLAWSRPQGTELTPLLRRLALQLPALRGSERRQAHALLARPTDGTADPQQNGYSVPEAPNSPLCSAHYCVHWVISGPDAPNLTDANANGIPDWVETTDAVAEHVHTVENDQLAWRQPKGDGTLGGDVNKTDIYLKQLGGRGLYGYAAPDPGQTITQSDHSQFAYLVLDKGYAKADFPQYVSPVTPLEVTVAHEYNHILQFNYDSLEDTWMLESTAVWMEGKVYPADYDYLQYLRGWTQLTQVPMTTFNGVNPNDRNNIKVYGSAVWNKWLDARYGQEVVRGAWEASLTTQRQSFAVGAYDASIRAHGGKGFASEFDRFAASTAEWQSEESGFPEGILYPDVKRAQSRSVNGPASVFSLNHTTYALVSVRPSSARRIRLGMSAPPGTSAALALVGRTNGSGTRPREVVALRELPKGGAGTVTLTNPRQYVRLTAVLVNSDAQVKGASRLTGDFIYSRDNQRYYARVTTDFTAPRVVAVSPRAGSSGAPRRPHVKVTFSEPVIGLSATSLRLLAPNGRPVKARVVFSGGSRGSRVATLVPSRSLSRRRRYRVVVTRLVTDTAVNPLSRSVSSSFTTGP